MKRYRVVSYSCWNGYYWLEDDQGKLIAVDIPNELIHAQGEEYEDFHPEAEGCSINDKFVFIENLEKLPEEDSCEFIARDLKIEEPRL